jgi:hypothetical protein
VNSKGRTESVNKAAVGRKQNVRQSGHEIDDKNRKHQYRKPLLIGNASGSAMAAPRYRAYYCSGWATSCDAGKITEYVEGKIGKCNVERIKSKFTWFNSFKVVVEDILAEKFEDPSNWPRNIRVNRYIKPRPLVIENQVVNIVNNVNNLNKTTEAVEPTVMKETIALASVVANVTPTTTRTSAAVSSKLHEVASNECEMETAAMSESTCTSTSAQCE